MERNHELHLSDVTQSSKKKSAANLSVLFEKFLLSITGILFLIGTFLTFLNIILRKFFSKPWTGMEELDSIMLVMLVFLPLAYLELKNRHLAVTVLYERLPVRVQFWLRKLQHVATLMISAYIFMSTWDVVLRNLEANNKSAALGIPLYVPYAILLIGFGLSCIIKCIQIFMPEQRGEENGN